MFAAQALIKELRQRLAGVELQQAAAQPVAAAVAAAVAPLEARLRQAQAAVGRKDVLVRELRAQLDAAAAAAAAQGGVGAAAAVAAEQAARDARSAARLRGEVARKESALQAAQAVSRSLIGCCARFGCCLGFSRRPGAA